jgi:DNA replication protein DnaC
MLGGLLTTPRGEDAFAAGELPVICDDCMNRSRNDIDRQMRAQHGADYLENSQIPEGMPAIALHPTLASFLTSDAPGLWLTGDTGAYKTTMATEFVRRWCSEIVRPARYLTEHEFGEQLKDWDRRPQQLGRLRNVSLLVLDDIGKYHAKEFGAADFFAVLDARYSSRETNAGKIKKTLFVSEHSYNALCGQVERFNDAALRRRLEDLCGGTTLRLSKPMGAA